MTIDDNLKLLIEHIIKNHIDSFNVKLTPVDFKSNLIKYDISFSAIVNVLDIPQNEKRSK